MAIKIRLKKIGKRNRPSYRVVVVDSRQAIASGKYLDNLGMYDPLQNPKIIKINGEKVKQWLAKGALPSETISRLLKKANITA